MFEKLPFGRLGVVSKHTKSAKHEGYIVAQPGGIHESLSGLVDLAVEHCNDVHQLPDALVQPECNDWLTIMGIATRTGNAPIMSTNGWTAGSKLYNAQRLLLRAVVAMVVLLTLLTQWPSTPAMAQGCANAVTVLNTLDTTDPGSLRRAIADLCPGGTINFAPALTASGPATIILTGGELTIAKTMTIHGPGANLLAISGNNTSRIFTVNPITGTAQKSMPLPSATARARLAVPSATTACSP